MKKSILPLILLLPMLQNCSETSSDTLSDSNFSVSSNESYNQKKLPEDCVDAMEIYYSTAAAKTYETALERAKNLGSRIVFSDIADYHGEETGQQAYNKDEVRIVGSIYSLYFKFVGTEISEQEMDIYNEELTQFIESKGRTMDAYKQAFINLANELVQKQEFTSHYPECK
jgi:NADPH-dependent curcumin reductase CurA